MYYIKDLERRIREFHWQEICTPEKFAGCTPNSNPAEWQRACDCWAEWMAEAWKAVAVAHAGRPLSDSEFLSNYGEWKDRESQPGKALLMIIKKDERPE